MRSSVFLAVLLIVAPACGDDPSGPEVGEQMSVAEQTAIEAALATVAAALESTGKTAEDTLMADLTRISGRLLTLQGVQGSLAVTGSAVGGSASLHGAALVSRSTSGTSGEQALQFVIAWEGLDVTQFTVDRAVVVMGGGAAGPWDLSSTSTTNAARLVAFDGSAPTSFYYNVSGSLTAGDARFGGGCPDIDDTPENRCETGSQRVAATVTGSKDNGATTANFAWAETVLPAFRVTVATAIQ